MNIKVCVLLLFFGTCVFGITPCNARPVSFYQEKAAKLNLAQQRQWTALLHYKKSLFSNESVFDSDKFFLSPEGKTNPNAELNATIEAFFEPVPSIADEHAQCLFPARFLWLNEQLSFEKKDLPSPQCSQFKEFEKQLDVYQTTFVYTDAYLGNPASLFGHTLLRLDKKQQKKDMPLLSHYMNYGAITGNDNGVAFIFKGLFGGYPGIFTVSPYYDAINLYNNMENRDLWEYRLTMTPFQTRLFVAHLWEAGHNHADYFFFSENCSYMLAQMLDAVYPDKNISEEFYKPYFLSDYVIPVDTIRAFTKLHPNAVSQVVYRPSKQSKIKHAWKHFSKAQKKAFKQYLAKAPRDPDAVLKESSLTNEEKASLLETAFEYLHYNYLARNIEMPEMRADSVALLKTRSSIPQTSNTPPIETPAYFPDAAHLSGAIQLSGGERNGNSYTELYLRPALHRLTDASQGTLPFSQMTYFETALRWYPEKSKFRLQNFSLLDIQSVPPADPLFTPLNFNLSVGVDSFQTANKEKEGYTGYLSGGVGYAVAPFGDSSSLFASVTAHGRIGGYLEHSSAAGAGVRLGILTDFDKFRLLASAHRIVYTQKQASVMAYNVEASVSLNKRFELTASFDFQDRQAKDVRDFKAGILFFF